MAREVCELLNLRPGMRVLDATLGLGGHSLAMLQATQGKVEILGLDRDETAIDRATETLGAYSGQVRTALTRFSRFPSAMAGAGWETVDAILADLGVSSPQLDEAERGFSFMADGPLDMRMGSADGLDPASRLVNKLSYERLRDIIRDLGEEPQAGRIARAIMEARLQKPLESTLELASLVERAYPAKWRATAKNHPATRTFQALRMAVNHELEELKDFLDQVAGYLAPGGRVAVISFHSLEDRLVKTAFKHEATGCICPPRQPWCDCGHTPRFKVLTKRPLTAASDEVASNSRARSAKLRVAERLPEIGPDVTGADGEVL